MNGGGSLARYYVSASYVDEGGMYKVDKGLKTIIPTPTIAVGTTV